MGFDDSPGTPRKISRRDFLRIASLAGGAVALCGTADVFALSAKRITVATGGIGSIYFAVGGGIAKTLTKYSGQETVAEITAGPADNCELVASKRSDLGLVTADTAYNAFRGTGAFEGNPVPIRVLTALYPNYTHVVTLENKGISKIQDLAGKQVAISIPGSTTHTTALRLFEAAGINRESGIKIVNMPSSESPRALRDGRIDAYIWSGGVPAASLSDLIRTPGLTVSLISHGTLIPLMNAKHGPVYYASTIPREVYPNMTEAVIVCAVLNLIICHRDMDARAAYNTLKIIFDHLREIHPVHAQAREISLQVGASLNSIPYHPGAKKFFEERGYAVPA